MPSHATKKNISLVTFANPTDDFCLIPFVENKIINIALVMAYNCLYYLIVILPRAASDVNVFGKVISDISPLWEVESEAEVMVLLHLQVY